MTATEPTGQVRRHPGTVGEVFLVFLRLGLTSFGGPVAHLGYFRDAFVVRRRWLTEKAYADLVALCQFLPGPASSQVGMALGLQRAGYAGMLAAWTAFTLPSAALLVAFGLVVTRVGDISGAGWIDGLKAAAVAVVAQAVLGMARTLTPDRLRATIAALAAIAALLLTSALAQVAIIAGTGVLGLLLLRGLALPVAGDVDADEGVPAFTVRVSRRVALGSVTAYAVLLVLLLAVTTGGAAHLFAIFYRAGALVFGGGHVVLPLLQSQLVEPGLVGHDDFLAGYGAAQAVPGPLFTFSAFLGTVSRGHPAGVVGAVIALVAIFLPGALLVLGSLPFWQTLRHSPRSQRALMGVNAGVVGILAAALYNPVFTEGISSTRSLALAVAAFVALTQWKVPPWAVVLAAALVGAVAL